MMDKQNDQWIVSCDDCDEVLETEKKVMGEAVQVAINNGWTMTEKYHYCEQCTGDHADEQD
jgi:hypothetical protein